MELIHRGVDWGSSLTRVQLERILCEKPEAFAANVDVFHAYCVVIHKANKEENVDLLVASSDRGRYGTRRPENEVHRAKKELSERLTAAKRAAAAAYPALNQTQFQDRGNIDKFADLASRWQYLGHDGQLGCRELAEIIKRKSSVDRLETWMQQGREWVRSLNSLMVVFSHWAENPDFKQAALALLEELPRAERMYPEKGFDISQLSYLAASAVKFKDGEQINPICNKVVKEIARAVKGRERDLRITADSRDLAALASALSKVAPQDDRHAYCSRAKLVVAREIARRALNDFRPRDLSTAASGLAHVNDRGTRGAGSLDADSRLALISIGKEIRRRASKDPQLKAFDSHNLSISASALVKVVDRDRQGLEVLDTDCREALVAIGAAIQWMADQPQGLQDFDPQHLSIAANALITAADQDDQSPGSLDPGCCRQAAISIGTEIWRRASSDPKLKTFDPQALSISASALVKLVNRNDQGLEVLDAECRKALVAIGTAIQHRADDDSELKTFNAQDLSIAASALAKVRSQDGQGVEVLDANCRKALVAVGTAIRSMAEADEKLETFDPQNLSISASALVKVVNRNEQGLETLDDDSRLALICIGAAIQRRAEKPQKLQAFSAQNLSNSASALIKVVDQDDQNLESLDADRCRQALVSIATEIQHRIKDRSELRTFDPQHLSISASALVKVPKLNKQGLETLDHESRLALISIGTEIQRRAEEPQKLQAFSAQALSSSASALIKLVDQDDQNLESLDANRCRQALISIGIEIWRRASDDSELKTFYSHSLAVLASALVKVVDRDAQGSEALNADCRKALVAIANVIERRAKDDSELRTFDSQALSTAASALVKVVDQDAQGSEALDADCRKALVAIATAIERRAKDDSELRTFDSQALSTAASALVKVMDQEDEGPQALDTDCRKALVAIGTEIWHRARDGAGLKTFDPQNLSISASALVKVTGRDAQGLETRDADCRKALVAIGAEIGGRAAADPQLQAFNVTLLSIAANALVKVHDDDVPAHAAHGSGTPRTNEALDPSCFEAVVQIERAVVLRRHELSEPAFGDRAAEVLARLANSFSRRGVMGDCHEGMRALATPLGVGVHGLERYSVPELAIVANALSRHAVAAQDDAAPDLQHLMQQRLHEIAAHVAGQPEMLASAKAQSLGMLVKAMGKSGLYEDVALLRPQVMRRLEVLREETGLCRDDLETVGDLCAALKPMLRTLDPSLRRHRRNALETMFRLLPHVRRKVALHLQRTPGADRAAGGATAPVPVTALPGEAWGARRPGLSIAHVLQTYALVCGKWKPDNVSGTAEARESQRKDMKDWLRQTLARAKPLLEQEGSSVWPLQALIESDSAVGSMHRYLCAHAEKIKQELAELGQHAAPVDLVAVARSWSHSPRPPQFDAALFQPPPLLDSFGREMQQTTKPRYSLLARITGGMPVAMVQLPGVPKAHMLERFVHRGDVPHCFNEFGGSRTAIKAVRFEDITAAVKQSTAKPEMLAVRAVDLLPDAPFVQFLAKMFPNKESFWYAQRLLTPSPPDGIEGLEPADHVLEGRFKVLLMPDRDIPGTSHPFMLRDAEGRRIALQPYDGCGFIKESLLRAMPAFRKARTGEREEQAPQPLERAGGSGTPTPWAKAPLGTERMSSMSLTALAHYPASEAVAREIAQKLQDKLAQWPDEDGPMGEQAFRCVATGLIQGRTAILIASADDHVHLPAVKSKELDGHDLVIAKSPFDKANLLAVPDELIGTSAKGDPTALALDRIGALQYSYVGVEDAARELGAAPPVGPQVAEKDKPWMGLKGIDLVLPDDMWPAEYEDFDYVTSAKDVKVHSHWTETKQQATKDTQIESSGAYISTEVFAPGSLAALPLKMIKRLDADCDGDPVQLFVGLPVLAQHVREHEEREGQQLSQSFKPPKSHTPAITDSQPPMYDASRTEQLLATYRGVIQNFTGLQATLLAQGPKTQQWMAERALLRTYEGIDRQLKRDLYRLLEVNVPDVPDLQKARQALAEAERVSAPLEARELRDPQHLPADKAVYEPARQLAQLLTQLLRHWIAEIETGERAAAAPSLSGEQLRGLLREAQVQAYDAANTTTQRLHALLNLYPTRSLSARLGYVPDEPVTSLKNLLIIGIKVGTDSFKSDTATGEFDKCGHSLKAIFMKAPQLNGLPYGKSSGRRMAAGQVSAQEMVERLGDNENLSAAVVRHCAPVLQERGFWPRPAHGRLTAAAREDASQLATDMRTRAEAMEPQVTAMIEALAQKTQGRLELRHKIIKSRGSLEVGILSRARLRRIDPAAAAQTFRALRYTLVYDDSVIADQAKTALADLNSQGARLLLSHNHFIRRGGTACGLVTAFSQGAGADARVFEVQFHTPNSFDAKQTLHAVYKSNESENLKAQPDQQKIDEYLQRMTEVCAKIPAPVGMNSIAQFNSTAVSRHDAASAVRKSGGAGFRAEGDSTEKLSTTVAKALQTMANARSPGITKIVHAILEEARADGSVSFGTTLHHEAVDTTKAAKSIRSKIERKLKRAGADPRTDRAAVLATAGKIFDAVRLDVTAPSNSFASDCAALMRRLETHPQLEMLRVKNAFSDRLAADNPYKGINAAFNAGGQAFEVQFHTVESLKAKKTTHDDYKINQSRLMSRTPLSDSAKARLNKMVNEWEQVESPARCNEIRTVDNVSALEAYALQLQQQLSELHG